MDGESNKWKDTDIKQSVRADNTHYLSVFTAQTSEPQSKTAFATNEILANTHRKSVAVKGLTTITIPNKAIELHPHKDTHITHADTGLYETYGKIRK